MTDKGMENLCNAIILQAVHDYRKAKAGCVVNGKSPESTIRSCERFFLSEWFSQLTKLDGKMLLEKLRKENT